MTENKYSFKDAHALKTFLEKEVLTSSEVIELLEISRQALHSLVKREKLVPFKEVSRDKLFLREDVMHRKSESDALKPKYRPYDEDEKNKVRNKEAES